jgi:hypothetical protein
MRGRPIRCSSLLTRFSNAVADIKSPDGSIVDVLISTKSACDFDDRQCARDA